MNKELASTIIDKLANIAKEIVEIVSMTKQKETQSKKEDSNDKDNS